MRGGGGITLYFAPLEGVTGYIFRNAHSRYFSGVDKYFAPFISTNQNHRFSGREMRDVLPENNGGIPLVPQLLSKNAGEFSAACARLHAMGYEEVNLNLGCPSGTVAAKGKGSGFLAFPEKLDRFLEAVFEDAPVRISVKTRLGLRDPEEFWPLLEIFNAYPISELIIHPRIQKDFYKHPVRPGFFERAAELSAAPVCYNGGVKTPEDAMSKGSGAVMIGRGLVADPALAEKIRGGPPADMARLRAFYDEVKAGYREAFQDDRNAMMRMKELWFYLSGLFAEGEKGYAKLKKARDPREFDALEARLFAGELLPAIRGDVPW
ncbi:tRNA-dihydrouridine synthase family protein [Oscillospiraceae bacterium OttesenSCG-928-F05]|nr:tRNA-dihydrouridine synthase family protein [Oscillospiraceae bacterium OttesenSCG-928-F05]